jgi:hypothetical protein
LSPVYRNLLLRDIAIYDSRVLATMDERTINEKDERVTKCIIINFNNYYLNGIVR